VRSFRKVSVPGNNLRMAEFYSACQFCCTLPAPKKGPHEQWLAAGRKFLSCFYLWGLFDFDVIARVHSDRTIRD
jgi:hypothetical protein